jgi:hypothetical protein
MVLPTNNTTIPTITNNNINNNNNLHHHHSNLENNYLSLLENKLKNTNIDDHYNNYNSLSVKQISNEEIKDYYKSHYSQDMINSFNNYQTNTGITLNHLYYENNSSSNNSINNHQQQQHQQNNSNSILNHSDSDSTDDNRSTFRRPRKIANKKSIFDINVDTTRGFSSNKSMMYNKNYANKKSYLKDQKKSLKRNSKKFNRLQRKRFSLVIRNPNIITHDTIIKNILNIFGDYKVCYIIVSFEGRNPINNDIINKNNLYKENNISDKINISSIDYKNNNNTPTSPTSNTTNNNNTITTTTTNTTNTINTTITTTNNSINDNSLDTPSIYDTSPHYHVLFKTKKTVDITSMEKFNALSINDNNQKGSSFLIKSKDLNKLNEISYIVKDGNVKTWGELPKQKPQKIKVTDDIANKIINENYSILDVIEERPGFCLMNLARVKTFKTETDIMKNMANLKSWNMLCIDIEKFNEKELEIFTWMLTRMPITLTCNERAIVNLSEPQLYIFGGVNAGKSFFAQCLRERLPTYDFNENDHHNFYNDDLIWLVIKDEFKGGAIAVHKLNQFLDGQQHPLNTKGDVIMKKRNQPCIFLANYHIFKIYEKLIHDTPMVKRQLLKRFKFIDLGVYKYGYNTNNQEDDDLSIYKLYNIINAINDIDSKDYERCDISFRKVFGKSLLEYLWDNKKLSDFMISKILRVKIEDREKKYTENSDTLVDPSSNNTNKLLLKNPLSIYDMNLLRKVDLPHCRELLNEITIKYIHDPSTSITAMNTINNTMNNPMNNNNTNNNNNDDESLSTINIVSNNNTSTTTTNTINNTTNTTVIHPSTFIPGLTSNYSYNQQNTCTKNNNSTINSTAVANNHTSNSIKLFSLDDMDDSI